MTNKPPSKTQQAIWNKDVTLKDKIATYFKIIIHEKIPTTPAISRKLDILEKEIRDRMEALRIKRPKKKSKDE